MRKVAVIFIFLSAALTLSAQERCATVTYKKLLQQNSKQESDEQFEQWIQQKLKAPKRNTLGSEKVNGVSTIPVVVHIIHNGEPVGTGTNISDAQVISQINVLNKDYQRLNSDASQTPAEFLPVAGMFNVQFVLARQDPEGLPTNGIVRVKGTQAGWAMADDVKLKSLSYWNSNDYLNIWVTNLDDPNGYIGYAKFPVSTVLTDLANSPNDPLTDGVVIHYDAFGSADDGAFNLDPKYNKGRTTTHEVGHFFGLYHIWGDDLGSCSGTDYVDDTPNQGDNYNGKCPTTSQKSVCGTWNDMFQNYMDYTNDACMNILTLGQVGRMDIVLQNSPRRATLPTSKGATAPPAVALDLGIKSIVSPGLTACSGIMTPSINVRNYGTNNITSATIQLKLNAVVVETKNIALNLSHLSEAVVTFNPVNTTAGSTYQISFEVATANGQVDENANNNLKSQSFKTPQTATVPLAEAFNTLPPSWSVQNPDGLIYTWQNISVPVDGVTNRAMYINLHAYEDEGAVDRLVSPTLDFSALTGANLQFDRAYAQYPGVTADMLRVLVSTDCSADLSQAVEVFNKSGAALGTTTSSSNAFFPTTKAQWATETISLAQFAGNKNVQLIFEVTNGYGNNIFLDQVQVLLADLVDLALVKINSPSPVVCVTDPAPSITVKNFGSKTINNFKVTATVGGKVNSQTFTNLSILPGDELTVTLNKVSLINGTNIIRIVLSNPNSSADARADNDMLELECIVTPLETGIPVREKFETGFSNWIAVSQGDEINFDIKTTNFDKSVRYPGFTNVNQGQEAWLVSPALDISRTSKASMFFDLSYAKKSGANERLRVLASSDCGLTFPTILYDSTGDAFSVTPSSSAWLPAGPSDWVSRFLYLDTVVGEEKALIAFVVTNDNGNNLYLDNLEFFIDDDPSPVKVNSSVVVYPSGNSTSSFNITFNLPAKDVAYLQVYNLMGQVVVNNTLPETLNQTYTVDFSSQAGGIYVVRVKTSTEISTTKIFVDN